MSVNTSPSQLSLLQMAQASYDTTNDAVRIVLGSSTGMAISLDQTDQVTTFTNTITASAALSHTSPTILIGPLACQSIKNLNLHAVTTSTITGPQVIKVQYSPSDVDEVWIDTSISITPSASPATVSGTAISSLLARRIKVITTAPITSGAATCYLVGQG